MSSLFLRLAAQATGQRGAMLHSPARLPYQPLPERLDQPAPASAAAAPALVDKQPLRMPTDSLQSTTPPSPPTLLAPAARLQEHTANIAQEEQSAPLPPQPTPGNRLGAPLRTEPAGLPGLGHERHAEIPTPRRSAAPAALLPPQPPGDLPAPAPTPRAPAELPLQLQAQPPAPPASDSEVGATLRVPERTLDKLVLPPPLFPANSIPSTPAPASAAPVSAPAAPAREPDEVHIHIGRIEITAIQEPKQASRPARKGAAPLSLDDYLARRKGDGR